MIPVESFFDFLSIFLIPYPIARLEAIAIVTDWFVGLVSAQVPRHLALDQALGKAPRRLFQCAGEAQVRKRGPPYTKCSSFRPLATFETFKRFHIEKTQRRVRPPLIRNCFFYETVLIP